jgi:hypothetical protein
VKVQTVHGEALGRNWSGMIAMKVELAFIGHEDWLLNSLRDRESGAQPKQGFRLGFAFLGYTPGVFAKSEKVVWNDWDARMGIIKSGEGIYF